MNTHGQLGSPYQMPVPHVICDQCGMHCFIEKKMGKIVASHPSHPACEWSHKAFEIPVIKLEQLPDEYFSEHIR